MEPDGGKATWNEYGYYSPETGSFSWGNIARAIARVAHERNFISTAGVDKIFAEEADRLITMGGYLWGTNSRCKAHRASRVLGWKPQQKSLMELLSSAI